MPPVGGGGMETDMQNTTINNQPKKSHKGIIIASVMGGIVFIVLLIIATILLYKNINGKKSFSQINAESDNENYVSLNTDIKVEEDVDNIKKNFLSMEEEDGIYTLFYRRDIPDFFKSLKEGEVFCVYPGENENLSYFQMGFCGKYISTSENENKIAVRFSMPEFKEVFSDISIDTEKISMDNSKISFVPNDGVKVDNVKVKKSQINFPVNPFAIATKIEDEITIGNNTAGFEYRSASKESLLPEYMVLCDSLKLSLKNKNEDGDMDFTISGDVTLDEPALKYVLDYHYDKKKDKVKINKFDVGFITKEKVNLKLKTDKEVTLDDLKFMKKSSSHIIEIDDVTDSEKGKTVLGTYVIGINANIKNPLTGKKFLQNEKNKVSYLSFGIAIQLTLTAKGELGLEYNLEESGFLKAEVSSDGTNKIETKGYEYPNPVTDEKEATEEQKESRPSITSKVKGELGIDAATGVDIGVCILGLIPLKLAVNCPEVELENSFEVKVDHSEKSEKDVLKDNYILDDDLDYLMVSINGNLKMHLGAKVNPGKIKKYTIAEGGIDLQVFKDVLMQFPQANQFSHSECGFGGIYTNEKYTDEELKNTHEEFEKMIGKQSIIDSAKDKSFEKLTEDVSSELGQAVSDIIRQLGVDVDSYKLDYFSGGAIYLRDNENMIVAEIITDDDIINRTGFHTGLTKKKTEQTYSAPDQAVHTELKIGTFLRAFFDFGDISDTDITHYTYLSNDSNERMDLIYEEEKLKLIVVSGG